MDIANLIGNHQPDLWGHGHIHDSVDFAINKTLIISAPLGYVDERSEGYCPLEVSLPERAGVESIRFV